MRLDLQRNYRRPCKIDYAEADKLLLAGKSLKAISHITGIKWNTLYSHYYTNVEQRQKNCANPGHRKTVYTTDGYRQLPNYKAELDRALKLLSEKHGIKNWKSKEGQAILAQYEGNGDYERTTGYEYTNYLVSE
jgi:hypothetical protein